MKLRYIAIGVLATICLVGCTKKDSIEIKGDLTEVGLSYENLASDMQFDLVDDLKEEMVIKCDHSSCGEVEIKDIALLTPYVNMAGVEEGAANLGVYVKYEDTVCNFEVSPSSVRFVFTKK